MCTCIASNYFSIVVGSNDLRLHLSNLSYWLSYKQILFILMRLSIGIGNIEDH